MKKSKRWMAIVGVGLAVLALTAAALPAAAASNATDIAAHRGGPGGFGDQDTYLAGELGITVEELQAAQQAANEAAIQQAVDDGLITQAQADALLERSGIFGGRSFRLPFLPGMTSDAIDHEALLAAELGISVDELQAARDAAKDAALQQAVVDGNITQEQADLMQAQQALRDYLAEQGLQDSLQSPYNDAVRGAVEAGVITQEQADTILSSMTGFGRFGGMRGFDGFGGRDGMRAPGGMRDFLAPNGDAAPSGLFQRGGAAIFDGASL